MVVQKKNIDNIWHESLTSTVPAFKQHCKSLCLSSKSKKNKPTNSPDFQYIEEMIIQAENMCKDLQNEIPNTILVFKLLVSYLRKEEDLHIEVIDVSLHSPFFFFSTNFVLLCKAMYVQNLKSPTINLFTAGLKQKIIIFSGLH